VAFKDVKYPFHVERLANDIFRMTIGDSVIDATVTETAEGALLATFGGETHRIFGMDEPLGLRLVVDGVTILMYVNLQFADNFGTYISPKSLLPY
jgi:acetyl-CoA carboxylase / biotin carboxylase 1